MRSTSFMDWGESWAGPRDNAAGTLTYLELEPLLRGHFRIDVACPVCGPLRSTPAKQHAKKLRVWRLGEGALTYCCARCRAKGTATDGVKRAYSKASDEAQRRQWEEQVPFERRAVASSRAKALALWRRSLPIPGTLAETHLREFRAITCPLPATLRFLPAWREFPPAMIAAFGKTTELEPGLVSISEDIIRGVHLTRLTPRAASSRGMQSASSVSVQLARRLCLRPANDLLGLAITEGIEDAISVHEATGLAAWAAGSASRLPAIAPAVPEWIDCVTVLADNDEDGVGLKFARLLIDQLNSRGIYAELSVIAFPERR